MWWSIWSFLLHVNNSWQHMLSGKTIRFNPISPSCIFFVMKTTKVGKNLINRCLLNLVQPARERKLYTLGENLNIYQKWLVYGQQFFYGSQIVTLHHVAACFVCFIINEISEQHSSFLAVLIIKSPKMKLQLGFTTHWSGTKIKIS